METVTLDDLSEMGTIELERTGLLWMDAQGHEGHIIQGASKFTDRGVPIVLEWDPKGLDEVGDRGKIERIAAESYTHFGNMRADSGGTAPKFWLQDIESLHEYANRFLGPDRSQVFTDILLVRLAEEEVPDTRSGDYVDMSHVMRGQSLLNRLAAEADSDDEAPRHRSEEGRIKRRARHRAHEAKRLHAEKKKAHAEEKAERHGEPAAKPAKPATKPAKPTPKSEKATTKPPKPTPKSERATTKPPKPTPKSERATTKPVTPTRRARRRSRRAEGHPEEREGGHGEREGHNRRFRRERS